MELKSILNKGFIAVKKYKYAIVILIVGLALMALPEKQTVTDPAPSTLTVKNEASMEDQLSVLLQKIDGVGDVSVMLTIQSGEKIIYQTNDDERTSSNGEHDSSTEVVIITDSNRNQAGLIKQIMPPAYQGAVIICQGADDPNIQLAVVDAVSNLTGLGTNKISVLKMK